MSKPRKPKAAPKAPAEPVFVGVPREPGQARVDPIPFYHDKGAKMLRYGGVPFNIDTIYNISQTVAKINFHLSNQVRIIDPGIDLRNNWIASIKEHGRCEKHSMLPFESDYYYKGQLVLQTRWTEKSLEQLWAAGGDVTKAKPRLQYICPRLKPPTLPTTVHMGAKT